MRRFKVPGLCRTLAWLDGRTHQRDLRPGIVCALYDWSLGLTWREARS
jgi:hypothetical protein